MYKASAALVRKIAENYKLPYYTCLLYTSQGRVTDHRIKLTLHRLENVLNGDLDETIDRISG